MAEQLLEGAGEISAAEFNRHGQAADIVLGKALGKPGAPLRLEYDTNRITVKNSSGADRRRGEILEFTGSPLTDFSSGELWLTGGSPTLANGFGVLLNPIPNNKFGNKDCQVAGVCAALVNVTDATHKFAKVTASTYVLQSTASGAVRILHKPSGTGEKLCTVLLSPESVSFRAVEFTLTSGFSSLAASATVFQSLDPATADAASITVHDDQSRWTDAITGCKGTAVRADFTDAAETQPYWHIVSCQRAVRLARATLTATMPGNTPTITGWTAIPTGEHVADPGAGTLLNDTANGAGHGGVSGDKVWFFRTNNAPTFTWQVIDVTKHPMTVLVKTGGNGPFRLDSDQLQMYQLDAYLEVAGTTPTWVTLFQTTDNCPF